MDYDKTSKKHRDDDTEDPEEQSCSSAETESGEMEVTIIQEQQQEHLPTELNDPISLPIVDTSLNSPRMIENTTSDVTENQRSDEA